MKVKSMRLRDAYRFGTLISDFDLQLWGEGNHHHAYQLMGAHPKTVDGVEGTHFVVSAPSAGRVSVIGSFNNWDGRIHGMRKYHDQGNLGKRLSLMLLRVISTNMKLNHI